MVRGIGLFFATAAATNISVKRGTYKDLVEQSKSEMESSLQAILTEEAIITSANELIIENHDGGEGGREHFESWPPRRDRQLDRRLAIDETIGGLDTSG